MLVREAAIRRALAYAKAGVHEWRPNWGPEVGRFLRSTGITFPAAWCMAMWHSIYKDLGVWLGGGASVGGFEQWARTRGEIVSRPLRGDLGCWEFTGDGWPDHVFGVVRVLHLGPVWRIKTVEGNTSSGNAGSQDDGDGVYVRVRYVRTAHVRGATFVRIPGYLHRELPPKWEQVG
jgi:hypothetical protein